MSDEPVTMYHVSHSENKDSILAHGLDHTKKQSKWGDESILSGTFMWQYFEDCEDYAYTIGRCEESFDVWQVKLDGINYEDDPETYSAILVVDLIDPDRLELVESIIID